MTEIDPNSISTLGPPTGGSSNRERTGARDITVSSAMRRVPDVRHIDVDLVQYDPTTRAPEVVIEASSDPRKASDLARRFGRRMDAYVMLLIHAANDIEHLKPVTISVWDPKGKKILTGAVMSWQSLLEYMAHLHIEHRAYRLSEGLAA